MCGVIGLIYQRSRSDLGRIAAELLETLEYRGYDSTGAAIQGDGTEIQLAKGVGAPSVMVHELGITEMSGRILCGQVRWATFGAVDEANAQPHLMKCKQLLYGAHNGNVTNCDELKGWLVSEGHQVLSDNDGEVVVHTVEHYFARELEAAANGQERPRDPEVRKQCMRAALCRAAQRLKGSYAAVVVDPEIHCVWAVKQGSSLYFGLGQDPEHGPFTIASSDLSAVLRLTRALVPLAEGEFVEFENGDYQVYRVTSANHGARNNGTGAPSPSAGDRLDRTPVRSRLRAKDAALLPQFETFMDQEISAQEQTCRDVISLFRGGSDLARQLDPVEKGLPGEIRADLASGLEELRNQYRDEEILERFHGLVDSAAFTQLREHAKATRPEPTAGLSRSRLDEQLASSEAGFFADLLPMARHDNDLRAVRVMDALLELEEAEEVRIATERFVRLCDAAIARGGRIFVVSCGTSYHAAKAAALFFNDIARTELIPILPGEFRGQYGHSLVDGDLFIAVSQSGETKDLIDVMNDVSASPREIQRVAVVNNVNSTLALEKSDLVVPLRCGPEIAVPATKSFMNQLTVFYCLALQLGEYRIERLKLRPEERSVMAADLATRREKLPRLPDLIRETFDATDAEVEAAAKLLYLCPSMQILATRLTAVAKEGALKVREVVLNHTEGFEGSEFKHGPNTILGLNTIFGPLQIDALLSRIRQGVSDLIREAASEGFDSESIRRMVAAAIDSVYSPNSSLLSLSDSERQLLLRCIDREEWTDALVEDYPLIYITGPGDRDVHLTISQINTHKIRGAQTVVIAEDDPRLRQAATKAPANNPSYRSVFISLPRTDDTLMTVFSSTVVLQRLALKMSELKRQYLDRLGIKDHGVHPDVPKNVSKSITVD